MAVLRMKPILLWAALIAAAFLPASAATPVRNSYLNARLGYEVRLPADTVCMRSEFGCGFNLARRFTETEWQTAPLPPRYTWVSAELNTGDVNTLERAVQKAIAANTAGRAGALELGRHYRMIAGQPACEIDFAYNAEENEAWGKVVVIYRERRHAPSVIYTFGVHSLRSTESEDVHLFHDFVAGFRLK